VQLVLRDVSFDNDVIVSVFETNIRVLGYVLILVYLHFVYDVYWNYVTIPVDSNTFPFQTSFFLMQLYVNKQY
jgi:hypothetical protein